MNEKDHAWIEELSKEEFSKLKDAYLDARKEYKETKEELLEEEKVVERIGKLMIELDHFEQDFEKGYQEFENDQTPLPQRLQYMYESVARVETELEEVKKLVEKFKQMQEVDIKKSDVMEKQVIHIEHMMELIKGLLKFK